MSAITETTSLFAPAPGHPHSQYLVGPRPCSGAPRPAIVLVALDGTERSDGALRVALRRCEALNATLAVLTIAWTEPVGPPVEMILRHEDNTAHRGNQRRAVEDQLVRVTGQPRVHGVAVLDGTPAFTIARVAIERHAALVIVGLGRHGIADRLFSEETALELVRHSRVPVLIVPEDVADTVSHAVVAVDFSEISARAAQAALDTVEPNGIVELVHVMPYVPAYPFAVEDQEPHERWAQSQLDAVVGRLVVPPGVTIHRVAIRGRAANALLAHTRRVGADLIVTGTHGPGFVERAMIGSVATALLRGARCAVLSVPRDPLAALALDEQRDTSADAPTPQE